MVAEPIRTLRTMAGTSGAPPSRALIQPVSQRGVDDFAAEGQQDHGQRDQRADGEGDEGGQRGMPRAGQLLRVDAQLHLRVRRQRVVAGQLPGDLQGQLFGQPALAVQPGELLKFLLRLLAQLALFLGQQSALGVPLGADRDVFASGHGEGAGDQGRDASGGDGCQIVRGGRGDTHHHAGH